MRGCIYNKKIYMIVSICMASIIFSNCFMNVAFGEIISDTNDNLSKGSIVLSNDMYTKEEHCRCLYTSNERRGAVYNHCK